MTVQVRTVTETKKEEKSFVYNGGDYPFAVCFLDPEDKVGIMGVSSWKDTFGAAIAQAAENNASMTNYFYFVINYSKLNIEVPL